MSKKLEILKRLREISHSESETQKLTSVFHEMNKTIKDPRAQFSSIVEILKKDPIMTAVILKSANTGAMGLVKQVSNLQQAVSMLGFSKIKNIFMANILKVSFDAEGSDDLINLWKHSVGTAVISEVLCDLVDPKMSDDLFTAGLLHDLGSFIIYYFFPDLLGEIREILDLDPNKNLLKAEKNIIGITHQHIGAFFANEWNFPNLVLDCVKFHHSNTIPRNEKYVNITIIANNLAKGMEFGASENYFVAALSDKNWSTLNLNDEEINKIVKKSFSQYNALISG